jgi:hypothetical protein
MSARAGSRPKSKPFKETYLHGEPVGVWLPGGGLYGVVGFLVPEDGISYMDDAYLDCMPTRHADHHLQGTPRLEGAEILLNGHCFHPLEGEAASQWRAMFGGRDVALVRHAAEEHLRRICERLSF